MKLLTPEIIKKLPPLYSNEDKYPKDIPIIAKFFTPWSNWTWYVIEGEKQDSDYVFFGLVEGFEKELGYFTLSELESVTGPAGLRIERDLHFEGKMLSDVM